MSDSQLACWQLIISGSAALGTILAVLVALFKEEWMQRRHHPDLTASLSSVFSTPVWMKSDGHRVDGSSYYWRLRVKNTGDREAKGVEVFAAELEKRPRGGGFERVERFLPMNLTWTHTWQREGSRIRTDISPDMWMYCDLGYVLDPEVRRQAVKMGFEGQDLPGFDDALFFLKTEVKPSTKGHLIEPGEYRLKLRIGAANWEPIEKTLRIRLSGEWRHDTEDMIPDHVVVEEIDSRET